MWLSRGSCLVQSGLLQQNSWLAWRDRTNWAYINAQIICAYLIWFCMGLISVLEVNNWTIIVHCCFMVWETVRGITFPKNYQLHIQTVFRTTRVFLALTKLNIFFLCVSRNGPISVKLITELTASSNRDSLNASIHRKVKKKLLLTLFYTPSMIWVFMVSTNEVFLHIVKPRFLWNICIYFSRNR